MKPVFTFFLILSTYFLVSAQKPVFNHLAIHVTGLQASTQFYKNVIGLDTIPEPFHDGKHSWFSIGSNCALHVIADGTTMPHDKDNHLCLSVPSVEAFIPKLIKAGIFYEDSRGNPQKVTLRPDGVKQIYFKDPDGYWIEINDAKD